MATETRESIEREFFTWDGWDEGGGFGDMQFYNCELVKPLGPYAVGEKFKVIWISYISSVIAFYRGDMDETPEAQYSIGLRIIDEIKEEGAPLK